MLRDLFSLFPAHAGVILLDEVLPVPELAFPRTCGGDPDLMSTGEQVLTFSPHMRG